MGWAVDAPGDVAEDRLRDVTKGVYRPAHMENGRFVPGTFEVPGAKP